MNENQRQIELRAALAQHWMRAERAVSAYVFSAITNFADAEDVVQQVAVEAARRFEEYDASRPFEAWVIWLAKSRVIDHYRKSGRDRHVFSESILEKLGEAQVRHAALSEGSREALRHCLSLLSDSARALIEQRYDDAKSIDAIAELTGKKSGAVRVALHRARNALAECVQSRLAEERA